MPRNVPIDVEPGLYDRARHGHALGDMPVIVADEVAALIDAVPDSPDLSAEELSYAAADYGIVAPPFSAFFVEATTLYDGAPVQRGMVVYDRSAQIRADGPLRGERVPGGTHWHLHLYPFLYSRHIGGLQDYGSPTVLIHLDQAGRLLDDTAALQILSTAPWPAAELRDAAAYAASIVPLVLKAIGALHRRAPIDHVTPAPAVARQAQRRDGLELHSFYRLKVRATAPQSREDFAAIGAPARAAAREHVVRGHFRWYGEAGLFGRQKNTMVWVPEHERGDSSIGRITKDYEVEE